MIRLSEEQRAILSCYSVNKEEVITGLRQAIPFIEDAELRDMSENLLNLLSNMQYEDFLEAHQSFDSELETQSAESRSI